MAIRAQIHILVCDHSNVYFDKLQNNRKYSNTHICIKEDAANRLYSTSTFS